MSVSPERIEKALTYADSWEEGAPEQLHIVVLAAALREAQAENEQLREALAEIVSVSLPDQIQERLALAALAPADEAKP